MTQLPALIRFGHLPVSSFHLGYEIQELNLAVAEATVHAEVAPC
jgi:hypothetical protein